MSPYQSTGGRAGGRRGRRTGTRNDAAPGADPTARRSVESRPRGSGPPEQGGDAVPRFFLYVEGARDRDILRVWARRLSPVLARTLDSSTVILGGRRPARAVKHFQDERTAADDARGLVVLDRDHHADEDELLLSEPGLELFTWSRRHIESYVLVPAAMRRLLARHPDPDRLDRLIGDHLPAAHDEEACRQVNAKHLLGHKGPLAQTLGGGLGPGEIARCMRADELHPDVLDLYARIRDALGLVDSRLEVIRRLQQEQG